jgi:hypothetical protein
LFYCVASSVQSRGIFADFSCPFSHPTANWKEVCFTLLVGLLAAPSAACSWENCLHVLRFLHAIDREEKKKEVCCMRIYASILLSCILMKTDNVRDHRALGRHSPNVSTILLRFFYDFSTIIPCTHLPSFPRKILVSRSKENLSPNLACTKFFYNFSTKSP